MAEHLSQSELDYPFKLLEYFNGFRISKAIFSACELGVFDLLLQSQKPMSAVEVAQKLGTSEDGIERLLDVLVAIEIVDVEVVQGTAFYSSTDVANLYLAKTSPKSLHDLIIYNSQTIYPLWNNLVDAVREGKNQNEKTFGLPSEEIFSAIYRSEEEMLKFMGLMNSTWVIDGHDIVTAFDLSSFKTVIDLGAVVQTAQRHFAQQDDTICFQEGDFFEGEIPPADLYILARIIHDWKEDKNLKLLKKIHTACHPGGGVLIAEALLFENRRGPTMVQMFSLNMLVQTEGKEHPPSHYTRLLTDAGFRDVQVCRTGKSYDAILALK
ncbi:acetylserotonin O-methyltransferase 2 isoform X2 [Sinocyclocheilus rhinocerous]|uniref:acetylserotonin O-methyltransferase 2 isoform X2 n=1 Tax=Sinocyclocheilus rhinocerous TaxID=307959 RepID=UPI0007B7CCE0|nr:PREDICTED: acetylserotonin O-methyltransferase-like isoform X2 [Sinocyclocheilus rhinocerous]